MRFPICKNVLVVIFSILIFSCSKEQKGDETASEKEVELTVEENKAVKQIGIDTVQSISVEESKMEPGLIKVVEAIHVTSVSHESNPPEPPINKTPSKIFTELPILEDDPNLNIDLPPPPPELDIEEIAKEKEDSAVILLTAEQMPKFSGCEILTGTEKEQRTCSNNKMIKYVYSNIKYPAIARENGVEGLVYIQFVVDTSGNVKNVEIIKDIGGGCGIEAMRVVKKMPKWTPGYQDGKPVNVYMRLPVKFKLQG